MSTLTILRGLPASGKTTYANKKVAEYIEAGNYKIMNVNRDSIRTMHGLPLLTGPFESTVTVMRDAMIRQGLKLGYDVISSDMNLKASYVKELAKIARFFGSGVEVVDFDVPLDELIRRDANKDRDHHLGAEVITEIYNRYCRNGFPKNPLGKIVEFIPEPYIADLSLPTAIIVDIDGTVAKMNGRSPYDYTRVSEDTPHEDVIAEIRIHQDLGDVIIFTSGREDSCREDTDRWLRKWVDYRGRYQLLMRETGDDRQDAIIKTELFDKHIRGAYNVIGVWDDRNQVVSNWRKMGLRVYQVADGDF